MDGPATETDRRTIVLYLAGISRYNQEPSAGGSDMLHRISYDRIDALKTRVSHRYQTISLASLELRCPVSHLSSRFALCNSDNADCTLSVDLWFVNLVRMSSQLSIDNSQPTNHRIALLQSFPKVLVTC